MLLLATALAKLFRMIASSMHWILCVHRYFKVYNIASTNATGRIHRYTKNNIRMATPTQVCAQRETPLKTLFLELDHSLI